MNRSIPAATALALALGFSASALAQQASNTSAPLTAQQYRKLDDMHVVGADGGKIGEVEDVLIDPNGQVSAVAVDLRGMMGSHAVIMTLDRFRLISNQLVTALTRDQIQQLPVWSD